MIDIARRYDFLVIEDDPYGELVYVDGADTTPIKAGDAGGDLDGQPGAPGGARYGTICTCCWEPNTAVCRLTDSVHPPISVAPACSRDRGSWMHLFEAEAEWR